MYWNLRKKTPFSLCFLPKKRRQQVVLCLLSITFTDSPLRSCPHYCRALQRGYRYISLKAALSAAGAASSIDPHNLVPDFAAAHNAAFKDLTAQDYAAADAAAESEHDNVGVVLAGATASPRAAQSASFAMRTGQGITRPSSFTRSTSLQRKLLE